MSSIEPSPLQNQRILVTRSRHQQSSLHDPLQALGATVITIPLIELQSIYNTNHSKMYADLEHYDWVVFTSVNAIDFFVEGLKRSGKAVDALHHCKIACVGPITAQKLEAHQLTADLIPDRYVAEGLIHSFALQDMQDKWVLLPRAETARDALPNALTAQGACVEVASTYRTRPTRVSKKDADRLNVECLDAVTFTSSSTVHALEKWIDGEEQARFKREVLAFCIGPLTSKTAQENGYHQVITAKTYTIVGLIESLTVHLSELTKKETII